MKLQLRGGSLGSIRSLALAGLARTGMLMTNLGVLIKLAHAFWEWEWGNGSL